MISEHCGIPKHKCFMVMQYLLRRGFIKKVGPSEYGLVGYIHRRGLVRNFTNSDLEEQFQPLSSFTEAFDFQDLLCDPDNWAFRIKTAEYAEDGYIPGDTLIFKRVTEATPGELVLYTNENGIVKLARYIALKGAVKLLRPSGRYEITRPDVVTVFGIVTGVIRRTARPITIEQWNSIAPPRPEPVNQWRPSMEWLIDQDSKQFRV